MAYTPRTFRLGNRTEVANSFDEETQLRWDGWTPDDGVSYTPPPAFSEAELVQLRAALGTRLAEVAVTASATAQVDKAHRVTAVSRSVTDGATTAGSTTITSATAAFVSGDVGSFVVGSHIAPLATITAVVNGTTATISHPAALTGTGRAWSIVKPVTITLPTGVAGDRLVVSKVGAKLSTVTIAAPASGTVNGAATVGLSAPRGTASLVCTAPGAWIASGMVDAIEQGPTLFRDFPVVRATDTHAGNLDAQVVGKRAGSGTVGTWEAWHQDTQGNIIHFNCGPGMLGNADAAALFGLGCDYEGTGIYLHNRATGGGGKGLRIGMDQGLTWAGARGLQVTLGSGAGIGAEFIQSPATTAPGPVARFWAQIAADSSQKLVDFHRAKAGDTTVGVRVGYVTAQTGSLNWDAPVFFTTDAVGSVPLTITGLTSQTANLQDWQVSGTGIVASITKDGIVQGTSLRAQGAGSVVDLYNTSGTANQRRFRLDASSGTFTVQARTDANASAGDVLGITHANGNMTLKAGATLAADTATGLKIGAAASKLGFFNATPIVKPTGVTVDAVGIHAALVSLGLIAA